jgi:hypothetical protein
MLNKDQILKANDLPQETVHVDEWGGEVCVRGLTGAERDKFETSIIELRGNKQVYNLVNIRAKLCALAICNEDGTSMFTEKDIEALSEKSSIALTKIFMIAKRLSGIGEEEIAELEKGVKRPFGNSVSD